MRNLSIIIPFFQKQEALQKTWEELLLQIHPKDEILIIDDHSPDGVPDFDCQCTEVIRPPKRTPHIYRLNTLRNIGVQKSKWDACIILDPDCVPNIHFLDRARKIYDPSVLFGGRTTRLNKTGSILEDRRMRNGKSKWSDATNHDCRTIRGGCMYFSKQRASLASSSSGLFDTAYDGVWGYEDNDFASACRNSGMRLRLDAGLTVCHQWHPHNRPGARSRNKNRLRDNIENHRKHLNYATSYKPAVMVLMVSPMNPRHIDRRMRAVFRHEVPLKVRLVNNGDQSKAQLNAMRWWSDRWAVDYVNHKMPQSLSSIRTQAMLDYSDKGYKYLVTIEDDVTPMNGSIIALISEMEANPQHQALSGYTVNENREKCDNKDNSRFQIIRLNKTPPHQDEVKVDVTEKAGSYHQPPSITNKVKPKNTSNPISSPAELDTVFEDYKNARQRDRDEGCLVTIIMPAVTRTEVTKKTITGIVKHANFPHIFKAIIHPDQTELIKWAEKLGIEVIPEFYSPIVKAKAAIVQLCQTKYLLMFDNDLMPTKYMKPMLDFMESHEDVGVCATAIEGHERHKLMHYGANLWVDDKQYLKTTPLNKGTQDYKYCNYVHHGATIFRMTVFEDVKYDVGFPGQGYEHEDLFLQLGATPWKIVNYNAVSVLPLVVKPSDWYRKLRGVNRFDSRKYLLKKWNLMGLGKS